MFSYKIEITLKYHDYETTLKNQCLQFTWQRPIRKRQAIRALTSKRARSGETAQRILEESRIQPRISLLPNRSAR